jgi:glycosyltransferase involved in cell wall biosynthesis
MKLFIQIPCFNEAETLPVALADLPRKLEGIDEIKWLVIDDGSTDNTAAVARENGVDYVVRHSQNMGLAQGFMTGLEACLEHGADIIINTDADNQYSAASIPDLIKPILDGHADLVIGARPIEKIKDFSPTKKLFQKLGSWVVRVASNTDIPDAPSGFRALTRDLACQVNVFSDYTYTLETIIQAGQKKFSVTSVPVKTNDWLRPSRLVSSIFSYMKRSVVTIVRIFAVYRPFRFFMSIALVFLIIGFLLGIRFLVFYLTGDGNGHIQSLIFTALLISIGVQIAIFAFIGDLMSANRQILEEIQYKARVQALNSKTLDRIKKHD